MKRTNKMLLSELMREISFPRGQASSDTFEDIMERALANLNIDEDLDNGMPDESDYSQIPTNNPIFVRSLKKRTKQIGKSGNYALVIKSGNKYEFDYYLIDTSAKIVEQFFVGVIRTDTTTYHRYNIKKAFDLKVETVHWSNLAKELRGQGVGKLMYTLVYEYAKSQGRALGSDSTLFEGSSAMWITYMSKLAPYFGIILDGIVIPIPKEEMTIQNKKIFGHWGVDGFVAMDNPPKLVRKIMHNVEGLSYINGEYGVVKLYSNVNDYIDVDYPKSIDKEPRHVRFIDYVNEFSTIKDLLKSDLSDEIGDVDTTKKKKHIKALIFAFADAMILVKQTQTGLVSVII